jgi:hypothetical protein
MDTNTITPADDTDDRITQAKQNWIAALDFVREAGLDPVGEDVQQVRWCTSTADVDRLAALGFFPHRYTYEGAPSRSGVMERRVAGVKVFAGCDGDLLDYAEAKATFGEHMAAMAAIR